ncbi:hypothetical protein LCL89_14155 [Halobacillus yeomjeoni]|uniref:hypothetical protein n=1 Tax=Halobacillus yeomjeoni TaxID=311194 RepID=UPI001CD74E74|nr:hypothetical protein [Halobacillus yeomjeoni]MCA0985171.1 hypothetical protein [Halobacillus yeomjeoni]
MKNHSDAAKWYKNRNFHIPKNCVVPENPPLPRELSGFSQRTESRALVDYRRRSRKYSNYVICDVAFKDTVNPPPIFESDFKRILGRVPVTQEANIISYKALDQLLQLAVKRKLISEKRRFYKTFVE